MAVIDITRSPVAPAGILGSVFGNVKAAFSAWSAERATRNALVQLSDRELEDIGLCRGDIDDVARSI